MDTEVNPLEAKLANTKKIRVDIEKSWDEAIISNNIIERNLAKVESKKKIVDGKLVSLWQNNTDLAAELYRAQESSTKNVESVKG